MCVLTKAKIIIGIHTVDFSKFAPGFMLQTDFDFFNVEIIYVFASNFVDIYSSTLYPFGFPPRRKKPHMDTLSFLVSMFMNQSRKVSFTRLDKDLHYQDH